MAYGRFYTVQFTAAAFTAATDLIEITVATDKPVYVWGWQVWNTSDLGDASEEVLELTLQRAVTAGSGGTSATPVALNADDSSAGFTCNTDVNTAHTGGTVIWRRGWNVRIPDEFWFPEAALPRIDAGEDPFTLTMSAPADSLTAGGLMLIEER